VQQFSSRGRRGVELELGQRNLLHRHSCPRDASAPRTRGHGLDTPVPLDTASRPAPPRPAPPHCSSRHRPGPVSLIRNRIST
jgi:hypothetical protein